MASDQIKITLPDGSSRTYQHGTTGQEIAESISAGLARVALSITVNDEIRDLDRPITENATIAINTWDTDDGQYTFWHSSAHLLAEMFKSFIQKQNLVSVLLSLGFTMTSTSGIHK